MVKITLPLSSMLPPPPPPRRRRFYRALHCTMLASKATPQGRRRRANATGGRFQADGRDGAPPHAAAAGLKAEGRDGGGLPPAWVRGRGGAAPGGRGVDVEAAGRARLYEREVHQQRLRRRRQVGWDGALVAPAMCADRVAKSV